MTRRPHVVKDGLRPVRVERGDSTYPASLARFLGDRAPERIFLLGNPELLQKETLGLFCSIKCPGAVILKTYDLAKALRDEAIPVIGGFHTPMEKECMDFLMQGKQPIVVCPARGIERMRLSRAMRTSVQSGRVVFVSPFSANQRRVTAELAEQRNRLVAALASEAFVAYAAPGGKTEVLCREIITARKPLYTVDCPENANLLALGAKALAVEDLSVLRGLTAQ